MRRPPPAVAEVDLSSAPRRPDSGEIVMSSPAFINIVVPFDPLNVDNVNAAIRSLTEETRGNYPKRDIRKLLRKVRGLHFMSLGVIDTLCPSESDVAPSLKPSRPTNKAAHLVIEITSDYGSRVVLAELAEHFCAPLRTVLDAAEPSLSRAGMLDLLLSYEVRISAKWRFSALGQVFSGSPGLTADRIARERDLAKKLREVIGQEQNKPGWYSLSPLEQLALVRRTVWLSRGRPWKWAFVPEVALPTEAEEEVGSLPRNPKAVKAILRSFHNMVWPLWVPLVIIGMGANVYFSRQLPTFVAVMCTATTLFLVLLTLALVLGLSLWRLNMLGATDFVDERIVSARQGGLLLAKENFGQQNHMLTVSRLKPGILRCLTLRLAFIGVGAAGYVNRLGFLGKNGVIHSARWMRLPCTDQLVFWSNYDGTWESYVADFIADAPEGVTGIWSNCIGFPRTRGIISAGATDGDRTVRWARRQQIPTPFWYAAYRNLSASRIRINSQIHEGFATAGTNQDSIDWFALFGSTPRPAPSLQVAQISTLAFGGLSRMRCASAFVVSLSKNEANCKAFVAALRDLAVYGTAHKQMNTALAIGFSARALKLLGLPREAIETFPLAFKQGMSTPDRARELGDIHGNEPTKWAWGGPRTNPDVLVLAYGLDPSDLMTLETTVRLAISANGHTCAYHQPLTQLRDRSGQKACGIGGSEPFGFMDGISQPVMRGAPQRNRAHDENDLVEPGELILGYPDNLGVIPPGPTIPASCDPHHLLPDAGVDRARVRPDFARYASSGRRDLGLNGTFLVVRQYEQDLRAFNTWYESTGIRIHPGSPVPSPGTPDFPISAAIPTFSHVKTRDDLKTVLFGKFFGRWKDGSSLVRHGTPPARVGGPHGRTPDNDFMCGEEDPAGHGCPFGAHIRRANPRDTRFPGSKEEIASVNRHRMLRVSRVFGDLDKNKCWQLDENKRLGVFFMCVNGDIERQFEFVQKTWLLNSSLQAMEYEVDPIVGRGPGRSFSIPTSDGPVRLPDLPDLTKLIGGGYFFIPSKALLDFLSKP
jgi:deferrochelatase/peroxidase EfeB